MFDNYATSELRLMVSKDEKIYGKEAPTSVVIF